MWDWDYVDCEGLGLFIVVCQNIPQWIRADKLSVVFMSEVKLEWRVHQFPSTAGAYNNWWHIVACWCLIALWCFSDFFFGGGGRVAFTHVALGKGVCFESVSIFGLVKNSVAVCCQHLVDFTEPESTGLTEQGYKTSHILYFIDHFNAYRLRSIFWRFKSVNICLRHF